MTPEAGGPLVAVCSGHRCAALRRLAGTPDAVAALAATVRSTSGAVLVTAPCLGPCAHGAVAAVAHREAGTGEPGPTVWLSGVQVPDLDAELRGWVAAGGPGPSAHPEGALPGSLRTAVVAVGPPLQLRAG